VYITLSICVWNSLPIVLQLPLINFICHPLNLVPFSSPLCCTQYSRLHKLHLTAHLAKCITFYWPDYATNAYLLRYFHYRDFHIHEHERKIILPKAVMTLSTPFYDIGVVSLIARRISEIKRLITLCFNQSLIKQRTKQTTRATEILVHSYVSSNRCACNFTFFLLCTKEIEKPHSHFPVCRQELFYKIKLRSVLVQQVRYYRY
jgi:hypothetical protein